MWATCHWATCGALPTAWTCSSSHWTHFARRQGETTSTIPDCAAATGAAPHKYLPQYQTLNLCRVAPSRRPPWPPLLSFTERTFPESVARYYLLQLAGLQGTCWGLWGKLISAPCRPPKVGGYWPYSPQILWKSSIVLRLPPKIATASVGVWPSQFPQAPRTPTVVSQRITPSHLWFTTAQTPEICLNRIQFIISITYHIS